MKHAKTTNLDEVLDSPIGQGNQLDFTCSEFTSMKYEFYLDQEIVEPSYYRSLINVLNGASENDLVIININSGGGMLDSPISIMEALKATKANTVAFIAGSCYSGATLIALTCDDVVVGEFATFMCHNSSYGLGGYTTDIKDRANFEHKMTAKIYRSVYKGFLTDEEIDDVLDNKTIWMDSDEVVERLAVLNELRLKDLEVDSLDPEREEPIYIKQRLS